MGISSGERDVKGKSESKAPHFQNREKWATRKTFFVATIGVGIHIKKRSFGRCGMISPQFSLRRRVVKKLIGLMFAVFLVIPGAARAQEKPAAQGAPAAQATPPANPITMSEKGFYGFVSGAVISAAQKMPEENYSFKPTPEVRAFGQIVGHVADASYNFCSQVSGEANPAKDIEKTKTAKADLVAALKDAVAYCNKTDAKGSEMMKMFGFNLAKLTILSINTAHTDEHYGNMVTYMRIKGIVPPTSENAPPPATK